MLGCRSTSAGVDTGDVRMDEVCRYAKGERKRSSLGKVSQHKLHVSQTLLFIGSSRKGCVTFDRKYPMFLTGYTFTD